MPVVFTFVSRSKSHRDVRFQSSGKGAALTTWDYCLLITGTASLVRLSTYYHYILQTCHSGKKKKI